MSRFMKFIIIPYSFGNITRNICLNLWVALLEWSQKEDDFDKKIWHFRKNKEFLLEGDNILHHFLVI